MKILVTGKNGQLGNELQDLSQKYDFDFTFIAKEDIDLADMPRINDFIRYNGFDWIINTAAYTAVDKAEYEKEQAFMINAKAVFSMVQAAEILGAKFIHISTDYVFDGKKNLPYSEEDEINPLSVYGLSKAKGEEYVLKYNFGMVIRSSWLYSNYGNNFVKTMWKLAKEKNRIKVVYDQIGTPTYAQDLAKMIMYIIECHNNKTVLFTPGLYHFSNEGVASWYDFAQSIFEYINLKLILEPIRTEEFPRPAPRPYFSVLDKSKIKVKYDISIPHWRESLSNMLKKKRL